MSRHTEYIGRYQIIEELGRGGMATVYHAIDPHFEREVAIKVLPREFLHDPTFHARFEREAKAIAGLKHPAIVPVYDFGEEEGQPFLVMAFLPGGSLADRIRQVPGGLPPAEIIRYVAQIAEALDYAHSKWVIHRDFKPSNVLIDEKDNAVLADFGIAKVSEATAQLTGSGIVGTPAYMAPEMTDRGGVTHLVDVYALGVTVFEMLAGSQPYEGDTPMGTALAHIVKPIPDVCSYRPDLPEDAQYVIVTAMAKDPADRYPSAGALAEALEQVAWPYETEITPDAPTELLDDIAGPVETLPLDPATQNVPEPATKMHRRQPSPTLIGGAMLSVAAVAIGGLWLAGIFSNREISTSGPTQAAVFDATQAVTPTETTSTTAPTTTPSLVPSSTLPPTPHPAEAFAGPILAAIADREPNYEDDFENPYTRWETDIRNGTEGGYVDGEYFARCPEQTCCGLSDNDMMPEFWDFVLEVDGHLATPGQEGGWGIGFRELVMSKNVDGSYGVDIYQDRRLQFVHAGGIPSSTIVLGKYQGDLLLGDANANHIQLIAKGYEFAIYVNGTPVIYARDENGYPQQDTPYYYRISLGACGNGKEQIEAHWDNLRVWDISDL
ncbi:MAG: serine/threonine protein kinase [Anaerolineae bacterium]|nr:serine/threonine protein kinase [Anaerolineae bacterium]